MAEVGGTVILVVALFLVMLFILWVLLPFAVFGTKGLISQLLSEVRTTNELLRRAREEGQR